MLILEFTAIPNNADFSMADLFGKGSAPGNPIQTGQHLEFGFPNDSFEHPQNNFDFVFSCTCTSNPITTFQLLLVFNLINR